MKSFVFKSLVGVVALGLGYSALADNPPTPAPAPQCMSKDGLCYNVSLTAGSQPYDANKSYCVTQFVNRQYVQNLSTRSHACVTLWPNDSYQFPLGGASLPGNFQPAANNTVATEIMVQDPTTQKITYVPFELGFDGQSIGVPFAVTGTAGNYSVAPSAITVWASIPANAVRCDNQPAAYCTTLNPSN